MTTMTQWSSCCGLLCLSLCVGSCVEATAQTPTGDQLPDTLPLVLEEPLHAVMVRGINRFAERELTASRERRAAKWNRDYSSVEAYLKSVEPHRQRLREMIGATDPPQPPRLAIGAVASAATVDSDVAAMQVHWDVCEGVCAEGILLQPVSWTSFGDTTPPAPAAIVIVVPDAAHTPEQLAGLEHTSHQPIALRLARSGCVVLVMATINRDYEFSGHPDIRWTNIPHRELIYRCGFELGRHIVGYEVEAVLQARRALAERFSAGSTTLAVAGAGDGGMVSLLAAAIEPEIDAAWIAGYFDERESIWRQPIDRNIFGLLTEFGDADVASLIAPRPLIIDNASPPTWDGPSAAVGRLPYAAPGRITPPDPATVEAEFQRAKEHYAQLDRADRIALISRRDEEAGSYSEAGLAALLQTFNLDHAASGGLLTAAPGVSLDDAARQKRLVESLIRHTQMILHRSDNVREKFWKDADRSSVEKWVETSQKYRDYIHDHMIGRLPLPDAPLNPRSRKVIDEPTHAGWEVVLDVYPVMSSVQSPVSSARTATLALDTGHSTLDTADSTVIAGGILLLPKDLKPGEKRPVVVCQHGLEGTPMDTITTDESERAWRAYKGFSTQLVKQGFIVYAPQNPYKGEDEFRVIQRKSNPLGRSLFSYIIEQHRQTLRWLATLPYVDPERIAFYGLSYGGKTAMRVPPLLDGRWSFVDGQWTDTIERPSSNDHQPLTRYCLSICSADFNEWIRKNCSAEDRYSYVYTKEYEMFEWNMGHVAGYAELASLMAPRPFMVERGHGDGVAPDEWVGWEFAKVRRHYDLLGIRDRAEIEWFNGPHTINGQGTFEFLHRHLNWP